MRLRRSVAAASVAAAWIACTAIAANALPLASPTNTPAAGPWSLAPGEYYTEITSSGFTASSAYDNDSKRTLLPVTVQQRAARWYTELGWKKRWSLQLSVPMVSNSARSGWTNSVSQTGLEDFGLGVRLSLHKGATASALQLRWEAPMGYNAKLDLPPGDGLQKLSAALQFGGKAGAAGFWQLGAGYRYDFLSISDRMPKPKTRNEVLGGLIGLNTADEPGPRNWSDHVVLNAAYARWFGRLQVAGLYGGEFPLTTGRTFDVMKQAAGPRFTYRVDERLDAFAGSWHTPAGKNSWHVDEFYAGFAFKTTKLNRLQGFLGNDSRP